MTCTCDPVATITSSPAVVSHLGDWETVITRREPAVNYFENKLSAQEQLICQLASRLDLVEAHQKSLEQQLQACINHINKFKISFKILKISFCALSLIVALAYLLLQFNLI